MRLRCLPVLFVAAACPVVTGPAPDISTDEPVVPRVTLPKKGIDAGDVAVLINVADPYSVAIGSSYAEAHGIAADRIIEVTLPVAPGIAASDLVLARAAVDALPDDVALLALAWTEPYRVGCMSITTALGIAYDEARFCSVPCAATEVQPTFDDASHAPFVDHGVRFAMLLAGVDVEQGEALIERGLAAAGTFPEGDGFLVGTTDAARSVRAPGFQAIVDDWAHPDGLALSFLDNREGAGLDFIADEERVLFYFTGLASVPELASNTFVPGAVGDHLTSFGGMLTEPSGQMSAREFLTAGATGSYGTVVEPCNFAQKFPDPAVLLRHYFRGEPLGEAYAKSVAMPGEGVFIGDPLASPWGEDRVDFDAETLTLTIETNGLATGVAYALEAADEEGGPYEVVQTVTNTVLARTTLTVAPADRAFYRLTGGD
jgi:uncharacterized protein (TIGR03790 family)